MEQYIQKSALLAEIERTQKRLNIDDIGGRSVMAWSECFKNFINTLEVKEEVTTTDAFIEKARKWFETQNEGVDSDGNYNCDMTDFEDFKNYIKYGKV